MHPLDAEYTYADLVRWGALELYEEAQVRAWFGAGPRLSVRQTLAIRTRASITLWAVMRAELIGERLLHGLAVERAEALLARLRAEGRYLDVRLERALASKRAWVLGEVSLGALSVARARAEEARAELTELLDAAVSLAAKAVVQATDDDGRTALRECFYTALELDPSKEHERAILDALVRSLGEGSEHWSVRREPAPRATRP